MRPRSVWDDVDGMCIHAVTGPEAPADRVPIVLVPGFVVSHRYMMPFVERVAHQDPVYAVDLPGHGKSTRPDHAPTVPEEAEHLVAWMDVRGLDKVHLVGNSAGCQVATQVAVDHPERIDRLVLQGPTIDAAARDLPHQLARWIRAGLVDPERPFALILRDYLDAGPRITAGFMRNLLRDRIEERLPHVRMPTLVVRGSRDPIAPQRWAEEVVRLLPDGRLKVIPGAAHIINHSSPLELFRILDPFLHPT